MCPDRTVTIIQSVICVITDPIESPTPSPKGLIKLRIDPGAVEDLLSIASSLGKLEHRSTTVADLAEAIQDTQSRIGDGDAGAFSDTALDRVSAFVRELLR
jgi:hypothetical protein